MKTSVTALRVVGVMRAANVSTPEFLFAIPRTFNPLAVEREGERERERASERETEREGGGGKEREGGRESKGGGGGESRSWGWGRGTLRNWLSEGARGLTNFCWCCRIECAVGSKSHWRHLIPLVCCLLVCCWVSCRPSNKQSASHGWICLDHDTCCNPEIEVADPSIRLTQSQRTDPGPTLLFLGPWHEWGSWTEASRNRGNNNNNNNNNNDRNLKVQFEILFTISSQRR